MAKIVRSWSKPDNVPNLIGRKYIDWSVFEYGTHIPIEFIEDFEKANGGAHIGRGGSREVILYIDGKEYKAGLVNVDRKGINIDTLQLRYDNNNDLKSLLRERLKTSYDYIVRARSEKVDNEQVKVPEEIGEYMELYDTGVPFCYEVRLIIYKNKDESGNPKNKVGRKITRDALIVAFYLSKFDKEGYKNLGFESFSQAFEKLADKLNVKKNTLKNLRDQFDSVNENDRVGWHQRPLALSRKNIVEFFSEWTEEKLREVILAIVDKRVIHLTLPNNIMDEIETDDEAPMELKNDISKEKYVVNAIYTLADLTNETSMPEQELKRWIRAIERKGQAILYGPPGTGKTYVAERLAKYFVSGNTGIIDLIQFHPAYAYEDFIQGIRPQTNKNGGLEYPIVPGRFLDFCGQAQNREGKSVLIIDEINRANLARVFGELMYLLEYRDKEVPLASGGKFSIPENVIIIGTMNTADRSIAVVDHALRRRFSYLALRPNYEVLKKYQAPKGVNTEGLIEVLKRLNKRIGDLNYEIGISFFMCENLIDHVEDIWRMEIEPFIEEYFFDEPKKAHDFIWEKVKDEIIS